MNVDYWFLSPLLCAKLIVVSDFEVTQSNDLCYNTTNKHDNMMQEYVRYAKSLTDCQIRLLHRGKQASSACCNS